MTTFAVHDASGTLVSVGTIVADPLPAGLTAVALTTEQDERRRSGWRWTPGTLAFDVEPPPPDPDPFDVLAAQVAAQQATIDALLDALGGES